MPLYEYICRRCDQQFELLIRGQEQPACPTCGGKKLDKQWSVPAAHVASSSSLPTCPASPGPLGCGSPECGMGRCALDE